MADETTKEEWEKFAEERYSFAPLPGRRRTIETPTESEATPASNPYLLRQGLGSTNTSIDRDRQSELARWTTGDPHYQNQEQVRQASKEETESATSFESLLHILGPIAGPAALTVGQSRDAKARLMRDPDDPEWAEAREEYARERAQKLFREARYDTLQTGLWDRVSQSAYRNAMSSLENRHGSPEEATITEKLKGLVSTEAWEQSQYNQRLAAAAIQEEYGENIWELDQDERRELMDKVQEERPDIALVWDPDSRYGSHHPASVRTRTTVSRPSSSTFDDSPEEVREAYMQLGRQWYDALQSGKYREEQHVSTFGPDFRIYGAGRDVLEAAISPSEALQMANTATNPAERIFWADLATPSGRATYDIFSTLLLDPLWFAGGAGGARTVSVSGKVYTTSRSTNQLMGTLDTASRIAAKPGQALHHDDLIRQFALLEHGTPDEVVSARTAIQGAIDDAQGASRMSALHADELTKLLDGTVDDATENLAILKEKLTEVKALRAEGRDLLGAFNRGESQLAPSVRDAVRLEAHENHLTRLITSLETKTGDWKVIAARSRDNLGREARLYEAAANQAGKMVEDVARGKHLRGIKQAPGTGRLRNGVIRTHIPFMENTYHLNMGGLNSTLVEAGSRFVPDSATAITTKLIGETTDAIQDVSLSNLHKIVAGATGRSVDEIEKLRGKEWATAIRENLSRGQVLAAGMQVAGHKVGETGFFFYDAIARTFGTRFMQPYMASLRNAAHAEVLGGTEAANRVVSSFPLWSGGLIGAGGAAGLTALAGAGPLGLAIATGAGGLIGRAANPGKAAIKVMRLQQEAWQKYQTAMGRYLQIINVREAQIARAVHRLYKVDGDKALKNLKARKGAEQKELLHQKKLLLDRYSEEKYLSLYGTMEDTIQANARILSDDYTILNIMLDVFNAVERGAGSLNPSSPFYLGDEFLEHSQKLHALLKEISDELKIPFEEASEALLQLSQQPYGNYERYHEALEELELLARKRKAGVLELESKAENIRTIFREETRRSRAFVELFSDFPDNSAKQKAFIEAIEAIRVGVLDDPAGMPGNRQWIRQTLARYMDAAVPGEGGALADSIIMRTKLIFTDMDTERAIRRLVVDLAEANRNAKAADPALLKQFGLTAEQLSREAGDVTLLKPRGFKTKLPENTDDWEWVPLEPVDYEPFALLHINRARKKAGLTPIGTWDKARKQWNVTPRLPGDGQITANSIRAGIAINQSELNTITKFLDEQFNAIVAEGQMPTAKELALIQRNIDKLVYENRRKAYALIGRRMWPHFEEWRRVAYPHPPNVRYSNPQTAIERIRIEIREATKAGDTDRVSALVDKLQRATERAGEVSFENEPWLLGREEFLNYLENWIPDEVIPGFPEAPSKSMPFYDTPSFTEHRLAKRFGVTEYTEEQLLEAAQRMLRYYEDKYGLRKHKLVFERNGEESIPGAYGWIVRPHYKITLTEKTIDEGHFLASLRHEIEHAIEYAMDPSFDPKRVRFLAGFATGGKADISQPFIRRKLKDGTVADVITHIFSGHHKRYSAFELDYVRRELVRDALVEGKAVDPKVVKEAGVEAEVLSNLSPLSAIYREAYELLFRADMWEGALFDTKLARLPKVHDTFRKESGHEAAFYKALLQFAGDTEMEDDAIRAIVNLYDHVAISSSRGDAPAAYDWWLRLGEYGSYRMKARGDMLRGLSPMEFLIEELPTFYRLSDKTKVFTKRNELLQEHLARVMQSLPKGTSIGDAFKNYLVQIAKTKTGGPNSPARAVIARLLKHLDVSEVPPLKLSPTVRSYFDNMLGGLSPNVRSAQLEDVALDLKLIRQDKAKGVRDEIVQVPISGGVGHFTVENILNERLLTSVEDARTPHDAVIAVRRALHEMFGDKNYPHINAAIDKMARRIGPALLNASKDDPLKALANERKAIEKIVRRTKEEMDKTRGTRKAAALGKVKEEKAAFVNKLDEEAAAKQAEADLAKPVLDPPLSLDKKPHEWVPDDYVDVEKWQVDLVTRANKEMEKWGVTSDDEKLLLILTLFKDRPNIPEDMKDMYTHLASKFPRVHGNRMGDVDPELYPLMESLGRIITYFEDMMLQQGRGFIADREHLIRTFGVPNYVPHLIAPGAITDHMTAREVSQKLKISMEEMPTSQNRAATLESRFAMKLDNAQRRGLYGTIAEINARVQGRERSELGAFVADPLALMGRYLQVSDAMAADELMTALLHSGTIRPVSGRPGLAGEPGTTAAAVANELDMVPVFQRGVPEASVRAQRIMEMLDADVLFTGTHAQMTAMWERLAAKYAGMFPGETLSQDDFMEALLSYKGKMDTEGPLAVWLRDVPELKRIQEAEDIILDIRSTQYRNGQELFNPRPRIAEIQDTINRGKSAASQAGDEAADAKRAYEEALADPLPEPHQTEVLGNLKAEMDEALQGYDEAIEAFQMTSKWAYDEFVSIAEEINKLNHDLKGGAIRYKVSAETLFDMYAAGSESWKLYMPRVVHQSMRDLLEVGELTGIGKRFKGFVDKFQAFYKVRLTVVAAAFTARNYLSNNMSNILDLGPFGALNPKTNMTSLQLSTSLQFYEEYGTLDRARSALHAPKGAGEAPFRYRIRQEKAKLFELNFGRMLDEGVDLGDGVVLHPDDAISRLKNHNVLSETFTQYVDIDLVERQILDSLKSPKKSGLSKAAKVASKAEDLMYLGLPLAVGAPLLALPKGAGASIARVVENQGRLCNFIGNMKRSGSWTQSAAHVNKFLFDYNDLTSVQRVWLRTIFPFFTWNIKNMHLQLEMMTKNPIFYAQFRSILLDTLPRAMRSDEDPYSMSWYMTAPRYLWSRIRMPVPGTENSYISGFGTPQEAFVEWGGPFFTLFNADNWRNSIRTQQDDAVWRFLGHSNFLVRLAAENIANKKAFQNIPIGNMTNGRAVYELMETLQKLGPLGGGTAGLLRQMAGVHVIQVRDPNTGLLVDRPIIMGGPNNAFASSPWGRFVRDLSKMGTGWNTSLAMDMFGAPEMEGNTTEERFWRWLDAYSGIGVRYYDPHAGYRSWDKRMNDAWREQAGRRGVAGSFEKHYWKLPKEIK